MLIMNVVWLQSWEESEAGWGQRPDGFSLHLTAAEDAKLYSDDFMENQREMLGDKTPAEYDRPAGRPYEVYVSDETLAKIAETDLGLRVSKWNGVKIPQPEPVDPKKVSGWKPQNS